MRDVFLGFSESRQVIFASLIRWSVLFLIPYGGGTNDGTLILVSFFYVVTGSILVPLFSPLKLLHGIVIGLPAFYYFFRIRQRGRQIGSVKFALQCAILTLAVSLPFLIIFPIPPDNFFRLVGTIDLAYLCVFLFFGILYPEIHCQFNMLREREMEFHEQKAPKKIATFLPSFGSIIVLSIMFTMLIQIIDYSKIIDQYVHTIIAIIGIPFVVLFTITNDVTNVQYLISGSYLIIFIFYFVMVITFVITVLRYACELSSKRRLFVVTIISLVAQYISGVYVSYNSSVFLISSVQIIGFLVLKLGYISRRPVGPYRLPDESRMTPEPTELYIRIPLYYVIKSRIRRLIDHGRS